MGRFSLRSKVVISFLCEYTKELTYTIAAIVVLSYCLHPARFASHYNYIKVEDISMELEKAYQTVSNSCSVDELLSCTSTKLMYPDESSLEKPSVIAQKFKVLPGGQWKPPDCLPIYKVAIILPYRDRLNQLSIFMNYIHPFLQQQHLDYQIFVIEQTTKKLFNRAKLFNVGFTEAVKIHDFHCFIFQDIDLIPQNSKNIYACTKMPRHMSSSVNTFRYNLPYTGLFGGAISLLRSQFEQVNGFSNVFWGWGGEDDDFYSRLRNKGFEVTRFDPNVAQYYMLSHKKEPPSKARYKNLQQGSQRYNTDGIKDLKYEVMKHELRSLYTWILVNV